MQPKTFCKASWGKIHFMGTQEGLFEVSDNRIAAIWVEYHSISI